MQDMMSDGMMTVCMIGGALFGIVIVVAVIVQTVVQVTLLGEVRKLTRK